MLEVLELGKNYISDTDALQSSVNKFAHLQELYIYMNEIRSLPKNLKFPQIKSINANRNMDLPEINLGFCPMLESLTVSYCAIQKLGQNEDLEFKGLSGCPNLQLLDLSFN